MEINSDLRAKEEELIRVNKNLELQREHLKQQYQEIKAKNTQKINTPIMKEVIPQSVKSTKVPEREDNLMDEIMKNIQQKQPSKQQVSQKNIKSDKSDLDNIEQKLQNAKKYDDKTHEISELEMINEEQDKILRLQRAKLEALSSQYESMASQVQMKEILQQEMQNKGKSISDQSKKYFAQINQMNERIDQTKQKTLDQVNRRKALEKENTVISKEIDSIKKDSRRLDAEINKLDIKNNRTQEEAGKLRLQQQQYKLKQREKHGDFNEANMNLKKENTKLEGSIVELFNSVKKQIHLADILRRQRVHLIAAKVFSFVEEDFMEVLDLGQRVNKNT